MADPNSIKPFPSDIDRDAFGNWLSGFTDGEAHFAMNFYLGKYGHSWIPVTSFTIALRADDCSILELIQSYWNCGRISRQILNSSNNSKPQLNYRVTRYDDLRNIVITHFEKYKMHAKKRRDFLVWREAVSIGYGVWLRGTKHFRSPWTKQEKDRFIELVSVVQEIRKFNGYASAEKYTKRLEAERPLLDWAGL